MIDTATDIAQLLDRKAHFVGMCKHFMESQNPRRGTDLIFLDCALSVPLELIPDDKSMREDAWLFYHTWHLSPQAKGADQMDSLMTYATSWRKDHGGKYKYAEDAQDLID